MMVSPLLSPDDLKVLPPGGVLLLDVREEAAYASGHLSGALRADLDRDLSRAKEPGFDPAAGGRHPLPPLKTFCATLGAWGIGPETRVICYDDQQGFYAARAWWMLRAAGHEHAQVLDGGLKAALEAGFTLSTEPGAPRPIEPYPASFWSRTTVDLPIVEKLARHAEWKVLDVRAGFRYRGEAEPIDPVAGHIPGALNLPFDQNLDHEGRFKSKTELRECYEDFLDGTSPERLIVHCGSGVTACHTLLALESAGFEGGVLYVGSWSEWCRSGKPVATGAEP